MLLRTMLATYERLLAGGMGPAEAARRAREGAEGTAWYEAKRAELRAAREAHYVGKEQGRG